MKTILTGLFLSFVALINAQCIADYNWGSQTFGISPNPSQGENFVPGFQGEPYSDIIYLRTPSTANDINPEYPTLITINSFRLDSVLYGMISGTDTTW